MDLCSSYMPSWCGQGQIYVLESLVLLRDKYVCVLLLGLGMWSVEPCVTAALP